MRERQDPDVTQGETLTGSGSLGPLPPSVGFPGEASTDEIGPYRIIRELGRGGMGVVYLAHDPRLERDVALKLLPWRGETDPVPLARFRNEARLLALFNHPNVATIYSLEEAGDWHFLTMEEIEGESIDRRLARSLPPLEETLSIVRQIARGLEAAHARGLVHRDLKPSNVMVRPDGMVKVLDFGLAIRVEAEGDGAVAQGVAGTPGYMSPEQVRAEPLDARADIWAFGCLLFACTAGTSPFRRGDVRSTMAATLTDEPDYSLLPASLSSRMRELIRGCLAKDSAQRIDSMKPVRRTLEEEIADRVSTLGRLDTHVWSEPDAPALQTNLPQQASRFVGRAREIEDVAARLLTDRMVSLVGVGGCGKTRLALEIAWRLRSRYPQGIWRVELAPISDPKLIVPELASALGLAERAGASLEDSVIEFLRDRSALILLDNCEHLIERCAELAALFLRSCPRLRLLLTTREALRIDGEIVYSLSPLALPRAGGPTSRSDASRQGTSVSRDFSTPSGELPADPLAALAVAESSEAVLLFVDRVRTQRSDFALNPENVSTVVEICRRLDGIPLALELAAAKARTLPLEKVRELLDDRFRTLARGNRGAQRHHATLRELVDWSHERLEPNEQAVFRRLSVFRGGWSVEAAEAICAGGEVEDWEVLDLFTQLVEKSLVQRDLSGSDPDQGRFMMLETLREYGAERLRDSGEEREVRVRHRDYFAQLAREGELALRGSDQVRWGLRLDGALDNVRHALAFCAEDPESAEAGLTLAGCSWAYWSLRGMLGEGQEAISRALAHPNVDADSEPFAKALVGIGNITLHLGEMARASELYERAAPLIARHGTAPQVAALTMNRGSIALLTGDTDRAESLYRQAESEFERAGNRWGVAASLSNLGRIALSRQRYEDVTALYGRSLKLMEELGDRTGVARATMSLGIAAFHQQQYDQARDWYQRSLVMEREIGHPWGVIANLSNLASLQLTLGEREGAIAKLREAVALLRDSPEPLLVTSLLETIANLTLAPSPSLTVRFTLAARALRRSHGAPALSRDQAELDVFCETLRAETPVEEWERQRLEVEELEPAVLAAELAEFLATLG